MTLEIVDGGPKGAVVVTNREIPAHNAVLEEEAVLVASLAALTARDMGRLEESVVASGFDGHESARLYALLVVAFADASSTQRRQVMALFAPTVDERDPLRACVRSCVFSLRQAGLLGRSSDDDAFRVFNIAAANAFSSESMQRAGLYPTACRIAHSCWPATTWRVGEDGRIRVRSLRRVVTREEVTLSYLGDELLQGAGQRAAALRRCKFIPRCHCVRCGWERACGVDTARTCVCPRCEAGYVAMVDQKPAAGGAPARDLEAVAGDPPWARLRGWRCEYCGHSLGSADRARALAMEARLHETGSSVAGRFARGGGDFGDALRLLVDAQRAFGECFAPWQLGEGLQRAAAAANDVAAVAASSLHGVVVAAHHEALALGRSLGQALRGSLRFQEAGHLELGWGLAARAVLGPPGLELLARSMKRCVEDFACAAAVTAVGADPAARQRELARVIGAEEAELSARLCSRISCGPPVPHLRPLAEADLRFASEMLSRAARALRIQVWDEWERG